MRSYNIRSISLVMVRRNTSGTMVRYKEEIPNIASNKPPTKERSNSSLCACVISQRPSRPKHFVVVEAKYLFWWGYILNWWLSKEDINIFYDLGGFGSQPMVKTEVFVAHRNVRRRRWTSNSLEICEVVTWPTGHPLCDLKCEEKSDDSTLT